MAFGTSTFTRQYGTADAPLPAISFVAASMVTPGTSANNLVDPIPAASQVAGAPLDGPLGGPCATARHEPSMQGARMIIIRARTPWVRTTSFAAIVCMVFFPRLEDDGRQ